MNERYIKKVAEPIEVKTRWGRTTIRQHTRFKLTEEGHRWLVEHYPTTFNERIAELFGCSQGHIVHLAQKMGLRKDASMMQHPERCERIRKGLKKFIDSEKGQQWCEKHKAHLAKYQSVYKFGTPRGESTRRMILADKDMMERIQKNIQATKSNTIRKERAREAFGLERKTKIKFRFTADEEKYRKANMTRHMLKHRYGCEIERGSFAVYNHTRVTRQVRETAEKKGFIFKD